MKWLPIGIACGALGCNAYVAVHAGTVSEGAVPTTAGDIELTLDGMWVKRGDGVAKPIALDTPIHTDDELAFAISTSEPLWLYVVNLAPDGSAAVVWVGRTRAHETQRVPEGGWFSLSAPAGHEVVAFVASRDGQDVSEPLLSRVRQETRRPDLVRLQSAGPPGFAADGRATMGLRAALLEVLGSGVRVQDDDDDVVLLVDLDHRPAD